MKKIYYSMLLCVIAFNAVAFGMSASSGELTKEQALQILGLSKNASLNDVRDAYKKLALQWHPDRNKGNEAAAAEKFKQIKEAYEVFFPKEITPTEGSVGSQPAGPKSLPASGPVSPTDAALNKKYSEVVIQSTEETKSSGSTLAKFVEKIGELISKSLCKDRAFTIMPNINDKGEQAPGFVLLTNER